MTAAPVTCADVRRLVEVEPGPELVPTTRRVGFENNGRATVQAYACRRRRCGRTYRGQWNFACSTCLGELSLRIRKQCTEVIGWLNGHPDDEGAQRIREAFIAIASRDWEPLAVSKRVDEPTSDPHGRRL